MLVGGPDTWHPNAEMFYRAGGGPLLDIAPYYLTAIVSLLGPISAVAGFAERRSSERTLGAGPRAGETFAVEVPTHAATVLRLAHGALATMTVSFEARGQYLSGLSVYGSEGSLVLPDANGFGGDVILRHGRDDADPVDYVSRGAQETRGLGIEELAAALYAGRPHRASGELALHVLETAAVARALSRSSASSGRRRAADRRPDDPAPRPPVAPRPVELGDVVEVLAVEPDDERGEQQQRGDQRQALHHLVLVVRDLPLEVVAHARERVA